MKKQKSKIPYFEGDGSNGPSFFLADRQGDKFRIIAFESFANFELSV